MGHLVRKKVTDIKKTGKILIDGIEQKIGKIGPVIHFQRISSGLFSSSLVSPRQHEILTVKAVGKRNQWWID